MTSADSVVNLVGILAEGGSQRFATLQGELPGRIGALAAKLSVKHVVHVSAIGASAESRSVYARSKAAGEAALHAAFPDAVILRPSIIFGARDSFFNRFAGMAMLAPGLPLCALALLLSAAPLRLLQTRRVLCGGDELVQLLVPHERLLRPAWRELLCLPADKEILDLSPARAFGLPLGVFLAVQ